MRIETKHVGEVEINNNEIITFKDGLLGFKEYRQYVILPLNDETPFLTMQCIEEPALAFIVMSPFDFKKDYEFELSAEVIAALEIQGEEQVELYSILVIPEKMMDMTANLKAPIVINIQNKQAKQVILENTDYPIKFYMMKQ